MTSVSVDRSGTGTPPEPVANGALRRTGDAMLGGVCAGIAERLGVRARVVRIVAVLSVAAFGLGLLAYLACWALIPREGEPTTVLTRVLEDRRQLQIVLAVGTVVVAVFITLQVLGLQEPAVLAWPALLSALCALCIWRGLSDEERRRLQERLDAAPLVNAATSTSWRTIVLRACLGGALLVVGGALLSKVGSLRGVAVGVFCGAVLVACGFLVLFAPWWLRTLRDLSKERRERVRAQERADVAAHLHDGVLQTLSLIQKAAAEPAEVVRLARNQERELRRWLFNPTTARRHGESFATAVAEIERDVELNYDVAVELVVVGDCPLGDAVQALLGAGREAAVNAAKWSGATRISIYAEAEPGAVSLFVRDQGRGFDVDQVGADRKGIACSIRERMQRNGGQATIRSAPGQGTEVELVVPLPTNTP